jgi:hypothetical protein
MKKIFLLTLLITASTIGILSCEKEEIKSSEVDLITREEKKFTTNNDIYQRNESVKIDENNVGIYHNEMLNYIFEDLNKMTTEEINTKISTSSYTIMMMKEFCEIYNIELPSDSELNSNFIKNENTSLATLLSNKIFSVEQKNILTECFDSLDIINSDISKNELLLSTLNKNLNKVKLHTESNGKTISIAIINQLIASDELWIIEDRINFLNQKNNSLAKGERPSNGQILGADAKGLGTALVFGGAYTPIGWAGSMFVGAGASIGSYMGGSNWWPY